MSQVHQSEAGTISSELEESLPLPVNPPQILAPAGGKAQFLAALQCGADAVYLGLPSFNARARAENFTIDDLRELIPLAHHFGMKVLITLNVLIKENELADVVNMLSQLESLSVDGVITQDLGVAELMRNHFPSLRMHASTQLAVHNLAGVEQAAAAGFSRVVLAREMTTVEMKRIHSKTEKLGIELEAFCHGSLCYSYSGLCFFSGAKDARSGNRGECSYTCREPYKVLNEPGQGFLFSMKDLDSSETIGSLVRSGIHTLKIEGRKKDAQYVASVVRLYRSRLDDIYGHSTLRKNAPSRALGMDEIDKIREDLAMSYQRKKTSFFLKGRYRENGIDLDNPTHKGLEIGRITNVVGSWIEFRSKINLSKYDGIRIDPSESLYHAQPQHGNKLRDHSDGLKDRYENQIQSFSLREMKQGEKLIPSAKKESVVQINVPKHWSVNVGDLVFKVRSADLKARVEKLTTVPDGYRLRPLFKVDVQVDIISDGSQLLMIGKTIKSGKILTKGSITCGLVMAESQDQMRKQLEKNLRIMGNIGVKADNLKITGNTEWHVSSVMVKKLKKQLELGLHESWQRYQQEKQAIINSTYSNIASSPIVTSSTSFAVKLDRLETLNYLNEYLESCDSRPITEMVFEPKRAFIGGKTPAAVLDVLKAFAKRWDVKIRLAIPTVVRAWDEPLLRLFAREYSRYDRLWEVGNIGAIGLLENWGMSDVDVSSDFSLYSLNQLADRWLESKGVSTFTMSVEDDLNNITNHLEAGCFDQVTPQVILYKDTPLFIAEACSLTALHGGCPGSKVCGYRSLAIQNKKGEKFHVSHENCKSIVYGDHVYSLSGSRKKLETLGVHKYRIDFLTRYYSPERLSEVLDSVFDDRSVSSSHSSNFHGNLK